MIDSFGAMGVLLTMVTILFTLWHPEIEKYMNIDTDKKRGNKVVICSIKEFYGFKLRVLLYGVFLLSIVIFPDIIMIIYKVIQLYRLEGINTLKHYKSIYPMYFMLWIFSVVLWKHIYSLNKKIKEKIEKLEG
ncbi:hypothetical protein [Acetoanaerobium noterae]|uniref:hypothetical protein n=1 Tax=Acetoanaerobium noterae TaxID=745369 RepID=UPI0032220265